MLWSRLHLYQELITSPVPSPLSVLPNERLLFHLCARLGCTCLQQDSLPICLFMLASMKGAAYRKHALCVAGGVPGPQTSPQQLAAPRPYPLRPASCKDLSL